MNILVAPSLLAADFTRLGEDVRRMEQAGADLLHLDVMDGHLVPNITFGPSLVSSVRRVTRLFLEAHLMIANPGDFVVPFADAGADRIIIHAEAVPDWPDVIRAIRARGLQTGVSIKPKTPLDVILPHVADLDVVLFMTVEPGFGGQPFMDSVLPKIRAGREQIDRQGLSTGVEVDGGIDPRTAPRAVSAGANILVAGTAIFGQPDPARVIAELKTGAPNRTRK